MIGKKNQIKSFSLLELLIVMGIVVTLASISLPYFSSNLEEAKYSTARENLRVMRKALDDFKGDHGRFPKWANGDFFDDEKSELVKGKGGNSKFTYMRFIPKDPFSGKNNTWIAVRETVGTEELVSDVKHYNPKIK
ncbi:type II secretion system protein [Candidatus Riflebacteria bacterium]